MKDGHKQYSCIESANYVDLHKYERFVSHCWTKLLEYITISAAKDPQKNKWVLSCLSKETAFSEFIEDCEKDVSSYPRHYFEAVWQHHEMVECLASCLTAIDVVAVINFAESYRVAYQKEPQSVFS